MQSILKKEGKLILLEYFILLILSIFLGCEDPSANKPNIVQQEPVIITNAPQLYNDYKANEISADTKYKNKVIMVVGMVNKIGKDILDKPYITLWSDKYSITEVQCYIQQSQISIASNLQKGDYLGLKGLCTGKSINILLENCLVQKLAPPEESKKKKRIN